MSWLDYDTVDSIVKPLGTIIRRLDAHAKASHARRDEHQGHADAHTVNAANAHAEALQANAVADKIRALIA